jgi:hypothetical protein
MQDNQRQADWGYVAGILDADGCFMISKHDRKRFSPTYLPCIKIAMIEYEAIDFISSDLGYGKYHIDRARISRPNSKPIYHWYMRSKKEIVPFLDKVIPHLRVKKDRALHLRDYCLTIKDCTNPSKGLVKSELNYREEAYKKMRKFNGNKAAATTKSSGPEKACDSLAS